MTPAQKAALTRKKRAAAAKAAKTRKQRAATRKMNAAFHTIIFHRASLPGISPALSLWWEDDIVDLLKVILPRIFDLGGNMPDGKCVDFIGACFAEPSVDKARMEVSNIYYPPEIADEDDWYSRGVFIHGSRLPSGCWIDSPAA
ncbi:MAG TPA: hypothetical protein VMF69_20870 [Gemmataceae bacterium]|nr:hypothetical protein [Gemmataceae bacterium]